MNTGRHRVGALRPNQLLHTFGVGSVVDLPNLSVVPMSLDHWDLTHSDTVAENRLLAAVRARLGGQVQDLRLPPHLPETSNPFDDWSRVGVPVGLFPTWLRCSRTNCNRLARADSGLFKLQEHAVLPDRVRYAHDCYGRTPRANPVAIPARFVLACDKGHLDDFCWSEFVHQGINPGGGHSLTLSEGGSTGEAAKIFVRCDQCDRSRPMSDALGQQGEQNLPRCRGRHPHIGTFESCNEPVRTLALGATNSWFAMQLRVFSVPEAEHPLDQAVAEHWRMLAPLATLATSAVAAILPTQQCWWALEPYGADKVHAAIVRRAAQDTDESDPASLDLLTPEWEAFTTPHGAQLPDFTTRPGPAPRKHQSWLDQVVAAPRLREVSALYGFTRIDAPEWDVLDTPDQRRASLSDSAPTWVPCAESRGEGIFLRFNEARLTAWEHEPRVKEREALLLPAHDSWRAQRGMPPAPWPGARYVLLHSFAHALIREVALECGYAATGLGERIYARAGEQPMAGVLIYTAAPDSEGTLGGLVSLAQHDRLGPLITRALEAATRCSSDPLCAEHDPAVHGRLFGAACHACLFAAETTCERGNHYLDRVLLTETLAEQSAGFFPL